mgnify:CR=1 FL=1
MTSLIASLVLAAALPTDFLDSVGVAAYWYKKDSRGRGDSISEEAKPRRFTAFALSGDTFILADPRVRAKHLDKVELWFGDRRYPAREIARGENPDTVKIRTESPVDGIRPLAFANGEPAERLSWDWQGDSLRVRSAVVGTNADVKVDVATGRAYHRGEADALLLNTNREPVAVDFGALEFLKGDRFEYGDDVARCTLPADAYDKAAESVEDRCVKATLPILVKLEQEDKTSRRRYSWRDDEGAPAELDAMGLVVGGRVLVPVGLSGEDIARLKSAEATFADGTKTNLVFAGALNEWNAIVFDLPAGCADKVASLAVSTDDPHALLGERAWAVAVENEGGRPVAEARRSCFNGVDFLRGAKFVASASFDDHRSGRWSSSDRNKTNLSLVLDGRGAIVSMELKRRYGDRWRDEVSVCPADLADATAGRAFNEEFRPRAEEDRNRVVWLGVESVELTDALAREKNAQSFTERYSRPPLVTEVYSNSPCAKVGIKAGDVLLAYRRGSEGENPIRCSGDYSGRDWSMYFGNDEFYSYFGITATPWTDVESDTNRELSKFGVGAKITLVYLRDGKRRETELTLDAAPPHYKNAPKSRNRALGTLVKDMTFEVRRFFKFDDQAPGVVIAKIKPGSPAAVAGLKVYELITEVNGEKVTGAKDFAAKIKDKKDLVFAVRRLSQTRMVKIHVQ